MLNGPGFRRLHLPVVVFVIVVSISYLLHFKFEGAFFTLYLLGIVGIAYFSGTFQSIIFTVFICIKLFLLDLHILSRVVVIDDVYRFFFFSSWQLRSRFMEFIA